MLGNVDLKRKLFTQVELSITPQYLVVSHLTDSPELAAERSELAVDSPESAAVRPVWGSERGPSGAQRGSS